MGAGSGPSNSLLRSLRAADMPHVLVGCHADRFTLKKSGADRNYLIRGPEHPDFLDSLLEIVERERIELLVPNTDADVLAVSALRRTLPCRVFLPPHDVIEACQDKYALTLLLRAKGVPAPLTHPVTDRAAVAELFAALGPRERLWCRIRTGSGSRGAIPVRTEAQLWSWVSYWEEMRGVAPGEFTLSEYLPGRDYSLQCLWKEGVLVLAKSAERLSYFGGGSTPSGMSSTPALAKRVFEPRVAEVCAAAIRALDARMSGVFCFDLKETAGGVPCVTEINAGRFAMITNIYDLAGKHNMAATFVRLAFGDPVDVAEAYAPTDDYYLVRDLDTEPGIFHADQVFVGIEETGA